MTAMDAGLPPGEAAQRFRVSLRTISRWRARHRQGESLRERPRSDRPPKLPPGRYPEVRQIVLAQPDAPVSQDVRAIAADLAAVPRTPAAAGRR